MSCMQEEKRINQNGKSRADCKAINLRINCSNDLLNREIGRMMKKLQK